jgi:hypothetical protein
LEHSECGSRGMRIGQMPCTAMDVGRCLGASWILRDRAVWPGWRWGGPDRFKVHIGDRSDKTLR